VSARRHQLRAADRLAGSDLGEALDLLAEVFLQPGADVRERAAALASRSAFGAPALTAVGASLRALAAAPVHEPDIEYVRLFLHGAPTVHPYESFYRAGSLDDPEHAADLAELYAAAGVGAGRDTPIPLDHIGLELDLLALFMHGLANGDGAARAAVAGLAGKLLREHLLVFTVSFCARLEGASPAPAFGAAGVALRHAVGAAARLVGEPAGLELDFANIPSDLPPAEPARGRCSKETPLERHKEDTPMRRFTAALAALLLVPAFTFAQEQANTDDPEKIRQDISELEARLEKVEKKAAKDRINFAGDFRFETHSIAATIPNHFDGMALQNGIVNTLFYYGGTGQFPPSVDAVNQFVAQNYANYLYFTNNLTFDQLKAAMGMFPPEAQQQLMALLMPGTYTPGYDADNALMYTSRLRLGIDAEVAENVKFTGRLSMYKTWGDSTGVQVFNGQSNSFNIDGNTTGIPNSDILRVERAYFDWTRIGGTGLYLSIGRRPSAGGPPMNLRQGELRAGSPMGSLIDFQFDGITVGYHLGESSTVRICYGRGYESGFGNGYQLQQPADRLEDADFAGLNWDIWNTEEMLLQATVAKAYNLTDGFNGLIVLPNNPLTGAPVGAPVVMRYTPSANLGDMDIAGMVLQRRDGPLDWFVNYNYVKSHPDNVTTPFGGLFSDPFDTPESHDGTMYYLGALFNFNDDNTAIGLEFNHGSEYWFNFTPAQDDIIAAKTNTRGDVYEAYLLHKINKRFLVKLSYIDYEYDYSGSGWHIGAPKKLDSSPILGFPTYDQAQMFTLSMTARF
jgi:TorA maturation chaperone TorD